MSASAVYSITHVASGHMYVGSSANVRVRWRAHSYDLNRNRHDNRHLQNAWCKYGAAAFAFAVIEIVQDASDLVLREQCWIDALRSAVKPHFNICPTAGSCRGVTHTAETRAKVSAASSRPRKPLSAEHRLILSIKATGRKMPPHVSAIVHGGNMGRKMHPNTAAAIRAAVTGRKYSQETLALMSLAAKNRSHEHRAQLTDAARRNVANLTTPAAIANRLAALRSSQTRAKISAALTGRNKSPEHLANIALAKTRKKAV